MTRLPNASVWQKELARRRSAAEAGGVIERAQALFANLLVQVPTAPTPGLLAQRNRLILPGLALYQALRAAGFDQLEALTECEILFRIGFFHFETRAIPLLNRLPDPFPLLRPALRQMCRSTCLPGCGEIIEDTSRRFVFVVRQCYCMQVLAGCHASELAPLFCLTDDWLAARLPKVSWKRTQTLARGGAACDFWWESTKE